MLANSNAVGAKKPRKKPKAPQVIAPEVWVAIEKAVVAGMGYSEAARNFGIRSPHAIIMRSRRDKWPVPSRVEERARQLQGSLQRRSEAAEKRRDSNAVTTETLAQDWVSRGEAHRALIYELTKTALRRLGNKPPPLEAWADIERADKAARRACGLDDSEATRNISVGLQLINQRLEIITADLPKEID
jgi:hypothetical protein